MHLYFGGAYNGKLEYIKNHYSIKDEEVFNCKEDKIDFSKRVINGVDKFIYFNAINGRESFRYFYDNLEKLKGKIIICDEVSSGIVPLKKEERFWREETGRVLQLLSENSTKVVRVFCGIPTVLKDEG